MSSEATTHLKEEKMKLVAVTLYPSKKAGSAVYSYKLYQEVAKHCEVVIFADEDAGKKNTIRVVNVWRRNSFWAPFRLFEQILKEKPQACHFQIEYRTFSDSAASASIQMLLLLLFMIPSSVRMFVTLHGVISLDVAKEFYGKRTGAIISKVPSKIFYKMLGIFVEKIIVHTYIMKAILQQEYKVSKDRIIVIPHGVDRARRLYNKGESGRFNLLFHGFIRPSKGLECLLKAMREVVRVYSETRLIIAGGTPHQEKKNFYIDELGKKIRSLQLENQVRIIKGFLTEHELEKLILGSNILVFPYTDNFAEASGALARIMDYERPIICTRTPRFIGDLEDTGDCMMTPPCNDKKLAEAIVDLIRDKNLRERLKTNLKKKATERYWDVLAIKYTRLFGGGTWT